MFVLDYPVTWYIFTLITIGVLFLFYSLRKDKGKRNIKSCLVFGFIGLILCVVIEVIGVSLGLWNYVGGNWPIILWLNYFISAMMGYQLLKLSESRKII